MNNNIETFPNVYCGECPYWLAYKEPDTSVEDNRKIEKICNSCEMKKSILNCVREKTR